MIIQLEQNIVEEDIKKLRYSLEKQSLGFTSVQTQFSNYLVCPSKGHIDLRSIGHLKGVKDVYRVSDQYKLVSSKWKIGKSCIKIGDDLKIGNGHFEIMSGPCSIESEAQIENTVKHLVANNIKIMRGGVYKPRSSPYSFRGLGIEGLKKWKSIAQAHGIKIVTEVMQVSQIEEMAEYVDIFQVGARNSQNFNLLDALGKIDKPILLKRGISGTIQELLQSAEYIFSNGNERIILCERGIRSFEKAYRNTLDLNAVALLKEKSHLPVVVDPSHGIGLRRHVETMAQAGIMTGADGLIIEVHEQPEKAFSDGQQSLNFEEAKVMYHKLRKCRKLYKELN